MGLLSVKKRYYSDWTVQELACRLNEHPIELGETVYRVHKADEGVYVLRPVNNPRLYGGRSVNSFIPEIDVFLWPEQDGKTSVELFFRPMRIVKIGFGLLMVIPLLVILLLLIRSAPLMVSLYILLGMAGCVLLAALVFRLYAPFAVRRVEEVLKL